MNGKKLWLVILSVTIGLASSSLSLGWGTTSKNCYWIKSASTGAGDWNNSNNWSSGIIPSGDDYAYINNGGTAQVTQNSGCKLLYLAYNSSDSGTVEILNNTLSAYTEYIGYNNIGTVTQSGGYNKITGHLEIGYNSSGIGTYNLSGGTLEVVYSVSSYSVMNLNRGTFNQNGGDVNLSTAYIGADANVLSVYNLSDGTFFAHQAVYIGTGTGGVGLFKQTGGTVTTNQEIRLGKWEGNGTYEISGGQLTSCIIMGYEEQGHQSTGTFKVIGDDANINFGFYRQYAGGTLITQFDADGISQIMNGGNTYLDGTWEISDPDDVAPLGRFTIMETNITGTFANVILPNSTDWSWGIDEDATGAGYDVLWVEHVPEPPTLAFLLITTVLMWRKKKRS